jgi:ABC-2 type transport system ATP-binding protein
MTTTSSEDAARQGAAPPARAEHTAAWAVEVHGLTKRFGARTAVDDVDLLVPRGCAFGYLGPNGAGKTTLIRALLGLTRPDTGTIRLLGTPVPAQRRRALARVGAIVDEPRFHPHLTGRENLRMLAAARDPAAQQRIAPALDRVRLAARADEKVSTYSMGMRQRLGLAASLLGDPQLLILDEPMNGLDPAGINETREFIRSLVAEGRTVMLSSHQLGEVERTCDRVAIVDQGKVIRQGPIAELIAGTESAVELECADPVGAARILAGAEFVAEATVCAADRSANTPARSTACWWRPGSPSSHSVRSTPASNSGSCPSPAVWESSK